MLLSRPVWRYADFFSAYLFQGLIAGFALTALANHYASLGLPATDIGRHIALVGLPWTLQPLWGPLVDRGGGSAMGRRRSWVVLALAGSHLALAALLLVEDPTASMGAVSAAFLAHSACAALLDTAVDGMIIDRVPPHELGRASACTRGGFVAGTALGAVIFSWSLSAYGFRASVGALQALALAASVLPVLIRERPEDALFSLRRHQRIPGGGVPTPSLGRFAKRLLAALRRREALLLLALCFTVDLALAVFAVRLGIDMIQAHGWEPAALSRLQGALAFASGTLGALLVGWWSDRAGPAAALLALFGLCAAAFLTAFALMALGLEARAGPVILGLGSVVPALLFVALVPAIMRASRRGIAATQFALFMATLNLGDVAGAAVSGSVASVLDLAATALAVALVFAGWGAAIALVPGLLFRPEPPGNPPPG